MTQDMPANLSRRSLLLSAAAPAALGQAPGKVRIAFIGTGHRTWVHIPVMRRIPGYDIVALADPTPDFLDRAATLVGSKPALYADYRKMFAERKDLDAVVVVTPGGLHADPVVEALSRGLHVLCEKPMATSIEDANRMIAAQKKSGKILQIGHQMRFRGVFSKLAEVVHGGDIGQVKFVTAYLHRNDWNPASWKTPDPKTGKPTVWRYLRSTTGSSLLEDGVHQIDVLQWVIRAPVARVFASGGNAVFLDRETIDHAAVVVEYENGVRMHFGFCLLAAGQRREEMVMAGDNGSLATERTNILLRKNSAKESVVINASMGPEAPPAGANPAGVVEAGAESLQLKSFIDNILNGRKPLVDGEEGKNAILIPIMAQRSIDERRVVARKEFPA